MNERLGYIALVVCMLGCRQSTPPTPAQPSTVANTADESVEFAGQRWTGGRAVHMSELSGVRLIGLYDAIVYPSGSDERLVVATSRPWKDGRQSNSWKSNWIMQKRVGDKWVNHGLEQITTKDDQRIDTTFVMGKREGMEVVFYPDGKLHRETEYRDDKRNGTGRAFWEDGSQQFVAQYVNDVEVSSESWEKGEKPSPDEKDPK